MKTITIEAVLSSSEFMKIAVADAIELVAKVNGQTLELTTAAFNMGVENVTRQVAKLVVAGAKETAKMMNEKCA